MAVDAVVMGLGRFGGGLAAAESLLAEGRQVLVTDLAEVPSGHVALSAMNYGKNGPAPTGLAMYHCRDGKEVAAYEHKRKVFKSEKTHPVHYCNFQPPPQPPPAVAPSLYEDEIVKIRHAFM